MRRDSTSPPVSRQKSHGVRLRFNYSILTGDPRLSQSGFDRFPGSRCFSLSVLVLVLADRGRTSGRIHAHLPSRDTFNV
jgi:hypothetical protein